MAILCWQMLTMAAMMADPTIPVAPAPAVDLDPRAEAVEVFRRRYSCEPERVYTGKNIIMVGPIPEKKNE